jgi:uncharacterized Zn finger protein
MGTALAVTQQQSIEAAALSRSRIHSTDRCPRCSGLMVAEWCEDLSDYTTQRCVQCGEVSDPVILQNRRQFGITIGQARRESTQRMRVVTGRKSG